MVQEYHLGVGTGTVRTGSRNLLIYAASVVASSLFMFVFSPARAVALYRVAVVKLVGGTQQVSSDDTRPLRVLLFLRRS